MPHATRVVRNLYRDSVSLMQLADAVSKLAGVERASVLMASEANLGLMRDAGLVTGPVDAGPNDLLIAVRAKTDAALAAALAHAERALKEEPRGGAGGGPAALSPRSIEMALAVAPGANLALISTPGEYAAAEAMKALRLGLHVMLFSDNVALEDEVALKRVRPRARPDGDGARLRHRDRQRRPARLRQRRAARPHRRGRRVRHRHCRRSRSLIDRSGSGVSQALGTGGHDLHDAIGGITMLQGLAALAADPATKVIVLVSKPPAPRVAEQVLAAAGRAGKPVVVIFLGADPAIDQAPQPSRRATRWRTPRARRWRSPRGSEARRRAAAAATVATPRVKLGAGQRYVRGLFSGGTFCYEAQLLLRRSLRPGLLQHTGRRGEPASPTSGTAASTPSSTSATTSSRAAARTR